MSESDTKKSEAKEENGSESKPEFALTTPTDIGSSFSFGSSAKSSEIKPFVFGSNAAENKGALSQTAPISALVEQRAKMANARRNKQTGETSAHSSFFFSSSPAAATTAAPHKPSFSFQTDSLATPFAVDSAASGSKTPFVFKSDDASKAAAEKAGKEAAEADAERARVLASSTASASSATTAATFSPGSTGGGIISPRTMTTTSRQRRNAGRGRGRRKNSNASDASSTATNVNDLKPAATASVALPNPYASSKDNCECDDCQCDTCRTRRAGGNRDIGDLVSAPEPKGPFERAPASELRRRKVVRVSKNNTSMHQASAAATIQSTSENSNPKPKETVRLASATGKSGGSSVANGTESRAVAGRADSDTVDDDDDSMPALEPSGLVGKEESSNEQNEQTVDDDDGRESGDDSERERIEFVAQRIASDVFSRLMEEMGEEGSEEESEEGEDSEEDSDEEESEDEESDDYDSDDDCMCDECIAMRSKQ